MKDLSEESKELKAKEVVRQNCTVDDIKDNDRWVSFYTGFSPILYFGPSTNVYYLQQRI